jgi:hypothetical protein
MDVQPHSHPADIDFIPLYRRADELDEDAYVDVTDAALAAGLDFPVALTREAWNVCVATNPAAERAGQDEHGRLSEVLAVLAWAAARTRPGRPVSFEVPCITANQRSTCIPLRAVPANEDAKAAVVLALPEDLS